jgi:Kef-type K+ transport system membrane component KefB
MKKFTKCFMIFEVIFVASFIIAISMSNSMGARMGSILIVVWFFITSVGIGYLTIELRNKKRKAYKQENKDI